MPDPHLEHKIKTPMISYMLELLEQVHRRVLDFAKREGEEEADGKLPRGAKLVCFKCGYPITSEDQRIEIIGSHAHTFANPSGIVFHIGCFARAPGTVTTREESADFTWFAGYAWSLCGCSLCGEHLGWRFRSEENIFFGLILDRLVEKQLREH